jgi:metal-responsive CopG/Arc/MetJ family transcriptional regulator
MMKRQLITLPHEHLEAFKARAAKQGQSLSEFMRDAAVKELTRKEQRALPEIEETRGRPRKE